MTSSTVDDGAMVDSEDGSSRLVNLLQESLHLAKTSCHFDSTHNYVGACDYYDKTIITLDEAMRMLPIHSKEWIKMLNLRTMYDERLELLRYFMVTQSSTATILSPVILHNSIDNNGNSSGANNNSSNSNCGSGSTANNRHRHNSEFRELNLTHYSINEVPRQPILTPYWILANIKQIIEHGGFISSEIFCPHDIWYQSDLKFSGISTKSAAFEIIIKLITTHIESLYLSVDEDSLTLAEAAFASVSEELVNLQNQLSKPFPYIKELKPSLESLDLTASTTANNGGISNLVDDVAADNNDSTYSSSNVVASTDSNSINGVNSNPMKPSGSSSRSLSQFVFAISKNVRKYAEVGYQRLAVALLTKLTAEELEEYKGLIVKLIDKAQTLSSWTTYILSMKSSPKLLSQSIVIKDDATSGGGSGGWETASLKIQSLLDNILGSLSAISSSIRDVVAEILLRDVQYLMDKYLSDARKAFSRMNWDDELEVAYLDN